MYVEIIHKQVYAGNSYSRAIILVHPKHRCHNQSHIRPYPSLLCVHVSSMYSSISLILCLPLELTYPLIPSLASTQLTHWQPGPHTHVYTMYVVLRIQSTLSFAFLRFPHFNYHTISTWPLFLVHPFPCSPVHVDVYY